MRKKKAMAGLSQRKTPNEAFGISSSELIERSRVAEAALLAELADLTSRESNLTAKLKSCAPAEQGRICDSLKALGERTKKVRAMIRQLNDVDFSRRLRPGASVGVSDYQGHRFAKATFGKPVRS